MRPNVDDFVVAFAVGESNRWVLLFDFIDFMLNLANKIFPSGKECCMLSIQIDMPALVA